MEPIKNKMAVRVLYALPRLYQEVVLSLPSGFTVKDALMASGLLARFNLSLQEARVGIWGEDTTLGAPLRAGDRVEIYRPLLIDPRLLRKQRAASQKKRSRLLRA